MNGALQPSRQVAAEALESALDRDGLADVRSFVGREAVLDQLRGWFAAVRNETGASVLVRGDPGIGKTRLLQRFTQELRGDGTRVLFAHGRSEPGAPVLWPWIEILRALLRSGPPQRDVDHVLRAFSPWLPLQHRVPERIDRARGSDPSMQFKIADTLVELVFDAAQTGPVCLVLEDLHDFDASSLDVLRQLLRGLREQQLLVLASCRRGEELGPEGTLLAKAEEAFAHHVALGGLLVADVQRMLELGLGRRVPSALSSEVHARAEGNPLYVTAVIGVLASADTPPGGDLSLELPATLWLAGQRQLDGVPAPCRQVLRLAALLGREFDASVVARLESIDCELPALELQLARACRERVVQRVPACAGRYRFTHALLREVLEGELDSSERAGAHAEAARALWPADGDPEPKLSRRVAQHWLASGNAHGLTRALTLAQQAASAAQARGAHPEAAAGYEIVVAALRRQLAASSQPSAADELRRELGRRLVDLSTALWHAGQRQQALAQFEEIATIGRALQDVELLLEAALGTVGVIEMTLSPEQVALCEQACAASEHAPSATKMRLLAHFGKALCYTAQRARGLELIEQAAKLSAQCSDPAAELALVRARYHALPDTVPVAERRALVEHAAALAQRHQDAECLAWIESWRVRCAVEAGEPTVEQHQKAFSQRAADAGPSGIWYAKLVDCMQAMLCGRFEEAERIAHEALAFGRETFLANADLVFSVQLMAIRRGQGKAAPFVEAARNVGERVGDSSEPRAGLAALFVELGRLPDARVEFARAHLESSSVSALCQLAVAAAGLGDAEAAKQLYARLLPFAERCTLSVKGLVCGGAVAHYLGAAAFTAGMPEQAIAHFEAALIVQRRIGARPTLARTHFELAKVLAAQGRADDARAHAADALQLLESLGLSERAEKARLLCAELDRARRESRRDAPEPPGAQLMAADANRFQRHAEFWTLAYRGRIVQVVDLKGMHYLEQLLTRPGEAIHVLDLMAELNGSGVPAAHPIEGAVVRGALEGYEEVLDHESVAQYRSRFRDLTDELAQAKEMQDIARQGTLANELEFLERELLAGARARQRPTERARKAVYNRLRQALERIEQAHDALGRHLVRSIKTGAYCSYRPEPQEVWQTAQVA